MFKRPMKPPTSSTTFLTESEIKVLAKIVDTINEFLQSDYYEGKLYDVTMDDKKLGFKSWDDRIKTILVKNYTNAGWNIEASSGGHGSGGAYIRLSARDVKADNVIDLAIVYLSPWQASVATRWDVTHVNQFIDLLNKKIEAASKSDKYVTLNYDEMPNSNSLPARRFSMLKKIFAESGGRLEDNADPREHYYQLYLPRK